MTKTIFTASIMIAFIMAATIIGLQNQVYSQTGQMSSPVGVNQTNMQANNTQQMVNGTQTGINQTGGNQSVLPIE